MQSKVIQDLLEATQYVGSESVDFEKMTWTFNIAGNARVGGGQYALVPRKQFDALIRSAEEETPT